MVEYEVLLTTKEDKTESTRRYTVKKDDDWVHLSTDDIRIGIWVPSVTGCLRIMVHRF